MRRLGGCRGGRRVPGAPSRFSDPRRARGRRSARDLLLVASQKGRRRTHACVVLKCMHVMHHLAGRELLTMLPVSDDQIFHLVEEKVLRTVEELKRRLSHRRVRVEPQERGQSDHQAARQARDHRRRRLRQAALPHHHQHRGPAGLRDARADPAPDPVQLRHSGAVGERHHRHAQDARSRRPCGGSFPTSPTWPPSRRTKAVPAERILRSQLPGDQLPSPTSGADGQIPVPAADDPMFADRDRRLRADGVPDLDARTAGTTSAARTATSEYKDRQTTRVRDRLMHGMKDEA